MRGSNFDSKKNNRAPLLGALNVIVVVAFASAYFLLKRMIRIRIEELEAQDQKERELVQRHFVEQIHKGRNEVDLWREG